MTSFVSCEIYWRVCKYAMHNERCMNRSYRKTPRNYPPHCKCSEIGRLSWKKSLRRRKNQCCDSDGTPILPAKISLCWPLFPGGGKRRQGAFGYGSYDERVYGIRRMGGKIVSTAATEDPYPGYAAKKMRMYRNK